MYFEPEEGQLYVSFVRPCYPRWHVWGLRTLVGYLEDGPDHLVLLAAFVRGIFCIFHFVAELEQGVFDVIKAIGWGLAVLCAADRWHGCGM